MLNSISHSIPQVEDDKNSVTESTPQNSPKKPSTQTTAKSQVRQARPQMDFAPIIAEIQTNYIGETAQRIRDLIAVINAGLATSLKNKKETIDYLTNLEKNLQLLQTNKFTDQNLQEICIRLLEVNCAIMRHISDAIDRGFYTIRPLKINQLMLKSLKRSHKLKSENKDQEDPLDQNVLLLDKLSKQISTIGVSLFNKAYRVFDAAVVDPIITYEIPRRSLMAGGLGAAAYTALSGLPNNFKDKLPSWLPHGSQADATGLSAAFLAANQFWSSAGSSIKQEWDNAAPKVSAKLEAIRNYLKGGHHVKIGDKLSGITEPVYFKDLIGLESAVAELDLIVRFFDNPALYIQLGMVPPKGLLFLGPPRCGKSLCMEALACEISQRCKTKIGIKRITLKEIRRYGLQNIFEEAIREAPCIIFIDEIDLAGLQRGTVGDSKPLQDALIGLQTLLSIQDPKKQVIVIGATNRSENIDDAIKQAGRLSKEIRFELPTLELRKEAIRRRLKKLAITFKGAEEAIHEIALQSEGASYEALNHLVSNALMYSRITKEVFGKKHLEQAVNSAVHKIVPQPNKHVSPADQQLLATHFAGQALAISLLDGPERLSLVTTLPHMPMLKEESALKLVFTKDPSEVKEQKRYEYGGLFTSKQHDSIQLASRDELLRMCKVHVAGIVAEEIVFGSASHTCNQDAMTRALEIAKKLAFESMKEESLPKHEHQKRFDQAIQLVHTCKQEVRALLQQHQDKLFMLIAALKERKQLNRTQVTAIINRQDNAAKSGTIPEGAGSLPAPRQIAAA